MNAHTVLIASHPPFFLEKSSDSLLTILGEAIMNSVFISHNYAPKSMHHREPSIPKVSTITPT